MRFHKELDPFVGLTLACGVAVAYVLLGLAGNRFMQDRKPLELVGAKLVYNLTQVVVCSITFVQLFPALVSAETRYGLRITPDPVIEFWVFVYYCCKFLDFGDTIFMVLGKKTRQYTLLHVWHHASIVPLFSYYLSAGLGAGFVAMLPLLNSAVHVVMYSHYLVTSIWTFKNMWWKPIVTCSQMGHHFVLLCMMVTTHFTDPECTLRVCAAAVLWGLSILGLFAHFYVQQYTRPKQKKAS